MKLASVQVVRIDDEKIIRQHMPLDETPGLVINGHLVSIQVVPEKCVSYVPISLI